MFNLFSAISGKFSTSLLLGTSLPVLLFLSLYVWVIEPLTPGLLVAPAGFQALETQWKALAITFALALFTGLLGGVNHILVRWYCGIPWQRFSVLAIFHKQRRDRLVQLRQRLDAIGYLENGQDDVSRSTGRAVDPIATILAGTYAENSDPLPTRLGNVFSNTEDYFKTRYGIAHSIAWWRLAGAMDASYAAALDESQGSFNFMLNSSFLAVLSILLLLYYAAAYGSDAAAYAWSVAAFAVIARLAYLGAVDRARAMGKTECAAIDLYRLNLLTKLGIKYDFSSLADERDVWSKLELSLALPGRFDGPPYQKPTAALPSSTSATSPDATLAVVRSVQTFYQAPFPIATIELSIKNKGTARTGDIVVSDAIPASWSYLAGSAMSGGLPIDVTGTAPFVVTIPGLGPPPASTVVTYRIQAWKAGNA